MHLRLENVAPKVKHNLSGGRTLFVESTIAVLVEKGSIGKIGGKAEMNARCWRKASLCQICWRNCLKISIVWKCRVISSASISDKLKLHMQSFDFLIPFLQGFSKRGKEKQEPCFQFSIPPCSMVMHYFFPLPHVSFPEIQLKTF